jgi:alkanesulfonate monooxygenase SsuD/methylene tetrahydromethanopterin reductase-like flavin-dependent oxidoreductase (luciferase family)
MKVSVLQFFSWPDRRVPLPEVYARALNRIEVMDRTGYDTVWLAEHHFSTYSVCPSVHMMGMHVAARTQHLRIGTAVTLAAFYHPLRIAEEVALLDIMSGGRVNWGAGRGFDRTEHAVFGVAADESYPRFRENVDIVLRAWSTERLTYQGTYWHFEEVEVLPKPLQRPHPPVWLAASSPDAVAWAAQHGFSILMDPHSTHDEIAAKRRRYEEELVAAGHSPAGRDIPVARLVAVARDHADAEAVAKRGAEWTVGSYASPSHGHVGGRQSGPPPATDPLRRYLDDVVIWGTPAEVAAEIVMLRDTIGLEHLIAAPLSHSTFELFTSEVLPALL